MSKSNQMRRVMGAGVLLAYAAATLGSPSAKTQLELHIPHTQELRAGESLDLQFHGQAGNSYVIEVDQGGLDVLVTVEAPDGDSRTFNSPLLRDESEIVVAESGQSGTFTLRLNTEEYTGATGRPSIRLSELAAAMTVDDPLPTALGLIADAAGYNHDGSVEGWNRAIDAYTKTVDLLENSTHQRERARSLFSIATIEYWQMLHWDKAAALAAQASQIYAEIGERRLAANAAHLQAAALIEKANEVEKSVSGGVAPEAQDLFEQALLLFHEARQAQEQLKHPYDAALITNNIGLTHYYRGDWTAAAQRYEEAATQFRTLGEWSAELMSVGNLAVIDFERGNLLAAIESFDRILELIPPLKSLRYRADTLDNLGASYLALGQLEESLQSFSSALTLHREISDQKGEARSLAGIGITYNSIGEPELALQYLETALSGARQANDGRAQVSILNFVGNIRRQYGEIESASRAHQEAQRLATAPIDRARAQVYLSQDLVAAGQAEAALQQLLNARSVAKELNNGKLLADVERVSGDALLVLEDHERSLAAFRSAATLYAGLGLKSEQAQATFGLARVFREDANPEQGIEHARAAIAMVENLRSQLIDPELRAFYLAARQEYYDFLIDALMAMHEQSSADSDSFLRQALSVSERSRARALVDLISELAVLPGDAVDAATQDRMQRLYRQMAEARYRLHSALDESTGSVLPGRQAPEAIRQELASIENELNLIQIENRERHPGLASLVEPRILDAAEMQQLLDGDTALLHFDLGEHRSFVWRITRESIDALPLPERDAIEEEARKLYGLLRAPSQTASARDALAGSLDTLSSQLLGSIDTPRHQRVLIVADGILQYIPFPLLHFANSGGMARPLLATHEIVYLPSSSVLAARRDGQQGRSPPSKTVAVFADPVLAAEDSRLPDLPSGVAAVNVESEFGGLAVNRAELRRLPATQLEAQAIAALVAPDQRLLALGFEANREAVLGGNLGQFRIVHFATHGLIDSRYPALSALAFSQFDATGQPRDGLLRLHEIYDLRLNADLVVLSACDTALGREILGEGLTGLTRGLMYAGARSVVASLWQVPDRATAELMKRFYQNVLDSGQQPAAALRNAQLDLSAEPRWRDPYYWAAFVLQGEWQ